jgi:hypothetical protein
VTGPQDINRKVSPNKNVGTMERSLNRFKEEASWSELNRFLNKLIGRALRNRFQRIEMTESVATGYTHT